MDQLIKRVIKWGEGCSDVRAMVILGSQARTDCPADEWSDLDLWLVVTDADRYLSQTEWLENIGKPIITFLEPTATGEGMERRVLFEHDLVGYCL